MSGYRLKPETSIDNVKEFLAKTGFVLEMEVAEFLKKQNFNLSVNSYFYDFDENKEREIDIVASKTINEIDLVLIIECKQSLTDDWVFICSDDSPIRYYDYVKCVPHADRIFTDFHIMDESNVPLAQNYIIKDINSKKSTSNQIDQCLEKIPKALLDSVYSFIIPHRIDRRTLLIPMAVFSGQFFVAKYNGDLLVTEVDLVQFESKLTSDGYARHFVKNSDPLFEYRLDEERTTPIAYLNEKMGNRYLIDFVTKKGLSKFINFLEKDIVNLDTKLWPIK